MSHCALVISLYMYITFMHLLFFLVHMVVADQQLFFQIKRVEGRYRASSPPLPSGAEGKPPAEKPNLFSFFFYLSFWIDSQKFPLACSLVPGCPQSYCHLKSFSLDKVPGAGGGGYHKVVAFIGYFFNIYILYIYLYIYIPTSFIIKFVFVLLWRYRRDVLLFASVSVAPLWGASAGRLGASLVSELEAPGSPGSVSAVVALAVTVPRRSALLALPAALSVVGPFLLVLGAAAGAGLLRLIHPQLAQRLTGGRGGGGGAGRGGGWCCRRGVFRWSLADLGIAELTRLLDPGRETKPSVKWVNVHLMH